MRRFAIACTVLLVAISVVPVAAVDLNPPPYWTRGADDTTWEHWDFTTSGGGIIVPEDYTNPYGEPYAELGGGWEWSESWDCPPAMDPTGTVDGWHCLDPGPGTITLTIPNKSDPDGKKFMFIQITSTKVPSDVTVSGTGPGGPFSSGYWTTNIPHTQWGTPAPHGGNWYTYNYGRWIDPNPDGETITIEVPGCTVVDQIVVDTICTRDPIANDDATWSDVKNLYR